MNRIIRSRLSCLILLLLVPLALSACEQLGFYLCFSPCALLCSSLLDQDPISYLAPLCFISCGYLCDVDFYIAEPGTLQECSENPDGCAATYEQLQLAAIQFCEEYPEECQEYFDAYVESLDEDGEE